MTHDSWSSQKVMASRGMTHGQVSPPLPHVRLHPAPLLPSFLLWRRHPPPLLAHRTFRLHLQPVPRRLVPAAAALPHSVRIRRKALLCLTLPPKRHRRAVPPALVAATAANTMVVALRAE